MTVDLSRALIFMLVMMRMTGMLATNPIFGRRGVPAMLHAGFAFVMAVLLTSSWSFPVLPQEPRLLEFFFLVLKEMAVGMIAGFVVQLFLSVLVVGGEIIDMQLGIGMAKIFDPATNASVSVSSSIFNAMFLLAFFATNNHLTFLRMAVQTYRVIPIGYEGFGWDNMLLLAEFFTTIFIFAMKLCMPIVIMEIVVTMSVGIIMRIIPQINVFVINIQFKLLIGIFTMIILVGPFMGYMENLIYICLDNIQNLWMHFF